MPGFEGRLFRHGQTWRFELAKGNHRQPHPLTPFELVMPLARESFPACRYSFLEPTSRIVSPACGKGMKQTIPLIAVHAPQAGKAESAKRPRQTAPNGGLAR